VNNGSLSITACMIKSILPSSFRKDVACHHYAFFYWYIPFSQKRSHMDNYISPNNDCFMFLGDQLSKNLNS